MNISFNFLDIPLRILLCLCFELLKRFLELCFHFFFHSSLLNFDIVLFFLNCFFKTCTILLPSHYFELVSKFFFTNWLHLVQIFIHFRHFDCCFINLTFSFLIQFTYLSIVILYCLIRRLFITFFKSLNFIF
jgi:hypothetical protein